MEVPAISTALRELATYLDLEGEHFRARAYERAAQSIEAAADVDLRVEQGRLTELPGIGSSLARVVTELAERGTVGMLDDLRQRWPPVVIALARLPRVGPARARRLYEALAPASLDHVAALCEAGQVRSVPGFGKTSEARLLEALRHRDERSDVLVLAAARELGATLDQHLRRCPAALHVETCGPARRWIEAVDHLAFAVATTEPDEVRAWLERHPLVLSLAVRSARLAVASLAAGVRCELHTAPPDRFGAASVVATGSAEHVAALDRLARERGRSLDDLTAPDEADLYLALGLPLVPPELRDGTDEISAALAGDDYADLVTVADIAGAVHCHTLYSDGKHTIEEMAQAAAERGFGYLTITDHSPSAGYAGGLTIDRLAEQWREIDEVQARVPVRLLRGTESDILADGGLDYPPEILARLDVVIASVHQRHRLDEDAMTRRLVTAMRQPVFKIWGHALGRLVLHREPISCRIDEVLDAIAESQAAIEINGDPRRLDLDPERARLARARGIRFVLSTDAHSTRQLDYVAYAVAMARRARVRRREVLNALPAEEFALAVRPVQPQRARRGA